MTDKEFKRLNRSQLIEIIYQLQIKQEELVADNERLAKELNDKRLRVSNAGNIAEAALEIHNVMQTAQDAAAHYLEEIRVRANNEYQRMMKEANDQSAAILEKAQLEAATILGKAQQGKVEVTAQPVQKKTGYDPAVEAILRKYRSDL